MYPTTSHFLEHDEWLYAFVEWVVLYETILWAVAVVDSHRERQCDKERCQCSIQFASSATWSMIPDTLMYLWLHNPYPLKIALVCLTHLNPSLFLIDQLCCVVIPIHFCLIDHVIVAVDMLLHLLRWSTCYPASLVSALGFRLASYWKIMHTWCPLHNYWSVSMLYSDVMGIWCLR